jgi:cyclophilin family peptidyl-prolyl cis-trans isomerase
MDKEKRPRQLREYVYWAIFIFIAVVTANILMDVIRASFSEQTSFSETTAINRKKTVRIATVETSLGSFVISFNRSSAPITVNNFAQLALSGFYDGTKIHRVVKDLLIQGGDPLSRENDKELYGTGGPSYVFEDEINGQPMKRGSVAMANSGKPNTNGSQFFVMVADEAPLMDGKYTVFGTVVKGMEVIDAINGVEVDENNIPIVPVVVREIAIE